MATKQEQSKFTHLHVHTDSSLLDGVLGIKEMVKKAVADNMSAIAITDHGNMFGTAPFYKECVANGIKPIIGCEVYTESISGEKKANHLILLAKNETGYRNLSKLVTWAYENIHRRPQVSWENLRAHGEGIICLTGCLGGEIPRAIDRGDFELAERVAEELRSIFGDDLYLEIQNHNIPEEIKVNTGLLKLSEKTGIKLVATGDCHYLNEEDSFIHDVAICIQTGKKLDDEDRMGTYGEGNHFQTQEEMISRFSKMKEAIASTKEIEKKIELELKFGDIAMPEFEIPKEFENQEEYFEHLCDEGFEKRFKGRPEYRSKEYLDRLRYEKEMIIQMGFPGYFLIVEDFIRYAKDNDIMVGPGRGSCVGSLVSYCMGITDLDPIPLGLLFERFLNPERVSNPDMDIDFDDERRDEVLDYVVSKYGETQVCGIITFGKFGVKGAIRDVARVLGIPISYSDRLSKMIPTAVSFRELFETYPEVKEAYETEPEAKQILDVVERLEGKIRQTSTHACGKVIAPRPIVDFMPEALLKIKNTDEYSRVSQTTDVEEMGLLKFDFLGLKTMNSISQSLKMINKKRKANGESEIKYLDIPLTDPLVYEYLSKGDTGGLFQIESPGMRGLMKDIFSDVRSRLNKIEKSKENIEEKKQELGQELFERIIAAVALYRPGPIDYIPNYLDGMRNPDGIVYDCEELEEILKPTYGVIVYQEQVQMIVRKLGGFSLGLGDEIRRAMGKKKLEVMAKQKEIFINGQIDKNGKIVVAGCLRNGISKKAAETIWDKMADFAKYAFNKSHAAAYGMLAYLTGWLKYYYPQEFITATVNSYITDSKKLKLYTNEIRKMGLELLPPDVNKSGEFFKVEAEKGVRFGLKGLKGVKNTAKIIKAERDLNGDYEDYQDLVTRVNVAGKINKTVTTSLIYSGAMDAFEGTRIAKESVLEKILKASGNEKKTILSGQIDLLDMSPEFKQFKKVEIPEMEELPKREKLEKEKESAGVYISEHPMDEFSEFFDNKEIFEIAMFTEDDAGDSDDEESIQESAYLYEGQRVVLAGIITERKTLFTKKDGSPFLAFEIEDKTGSVKGILFPKNMEENRYLLEEGAIVVVEGHMTKSDFGIQVIAKKVSNMNSILNQEKAKQVWIKCMSEKELSSISEKVSSMVSPLLEPKKTVPLYGYWNKKAYNISNIDIEDISLFSFLANEYGDNFKVVYH